MYPYMRVQIGCVELQTLESGKYSTNTGNASEGRRTTDPNIDNIGNG